MMSSTEALRRLLDERGVKYDTHGERYGTWYDTPLGGHVYVPENNAGYLHVKSDAMTPEQAIAATLGRGTCHIKPWKMEYDTGFYDCMECECGYVSDVSDWAKWHFCPNCGREVVE